MDELRFVSGYLRQTFDNLDGLIQAAHARLADVEFDTMVGAGLSGALVIPALARALDKRFLIVRKPNESIHASYPVEGYLGTRWIFVDDFIDSGDTYEKVLSAVHDITASCGRGVTHVGAYLYNVDRFQIPPKGVRS